MPSNSPSKFTGMIPKHVPEEGTAPETEKANHSEDKARKRNPGKVRKSNNSDYRQTNFYINVETFADAQARLQKERSGRDMSDLINDLVAKWLVESAS